MSTASEISRLRDARDIIRNKLVNFGVADSTDLIDTLASKLDAISNNGAVSATV